MIPNLLEFFCYQIPRSCKGIIVVWRIGKVDVDAMCGCYQQVIDVISRVNVKSWLLLGIYAGIDYRLQ